MRPPALKRFSEALKLANFTAVGGPDPTATAPLAANSSASSATSNTGYVRRMLSPSVAMRGPLRRQTPNSFPQA